MCYILILYKQVLDSLRRIETKKKDKMWGDPRSPPHAIRISILICIVEYSRALIERSRQSERHLKEKCRGIHSRCRMLLVLLVY